MPGCGVPSLLGSSGWAPAKAGSISEIVAVLWEGPPPQTPSPLVPQLSYNTVSACNRLCRTRLLCNPGKEHEELVSPQEPPDPTQHGLGLGEKGFGGVSLWFSLWQYAAGPLFWAGGAERG